MEEIRELPLELNKYGNRYRLYKRGRRALMYSVGPVKYAYYEVFKITIRPEEEILGRQYPVREAFPSNSDFGITAWCITDLDRALARFDDLESDEGIDGMDNGYMT